MQQMCLFWWSLDPWFAIDLIMLEVYKANSVSKALLVDGLLNFGLQQNDT